VTELRLEGLIRFVEVDGQQVGFHRARTWPPNSASVSPVT